MESGGGSREVDFLKLSLFLLKKSISNEALIEILSLASFTDLLRPNYCISRSVIDSLYFSKVIVCAFIA